MANRKVRIGIAGLGRAFSLMLPTFVGDSRVQLVAAADPRRQARELFSREFDAPAYATVEELCRVREIDAIYVATPHEHHAYHVRIAANAQKHVLVEKPMALTLEDCRSMIDAAREAGTHLIVGHSHSFNRPIQRAREIIVGGTLGKVRMITALNYTDFLYRPRRAEELMTERGGGVVFSQAAHQIDVVRLLGGGKLKTVRAATGNWDPARSTEGAYMAMLTFEDGAAASIIYSGYGHYDSDVLMEWVGELGYRKNPDEYGSARKSLKAAMNPADEADLKAARTYGGRNYDDRPVSAASHQHFGYILVSCERGDLQPLPSGVNIYTDTERTSDSLAPPIIPRVEVIDELYDAVVHDRKPIHSGEWSMATIEACLALLRSAREDLEISLEHQTSLVEAP